MILLNDGAFKISCFFDQKKLICDFKYVTKVTFCDELK
jgi:hypothetical protein